MLPSNLDQLTPDPATHRRAGLRPGQGTGNGGRFRPRRAGHRPLRVVLTGPRPRFPPEGVGVHPPIPGRSPGKKGGAARVCSCGATGRHKGNATKTVMTALGAIVLWRAYFSCRACRPGGLPRRPPPGPGRVPHATGHAAGLPARGPAFLRRRRAAPGRVLRLEGQRRDGSAGRARRRSTPDRRVPGRFARRRRGLRRRRRGHRVPDRRRQGQHDRGLAGHEDRHLRPPRTRRAGHARGVGRARPAGADDAGRRSRRSRRSTTSPPAGASGRPGWGSPTGRRSPSWGTGPNGSGTPRRGSSAAVTRSWTSTTRPSTSPTRARASSARGRRGGGLAGARPRPAAVRRLGRALRPHRGDAGGGPRVGRARGVGRR